MKKDIDTFIIKKNTFIVITLSLTLAAIGFMQGGISDMLISSLTPLITGFILINSTKFTKKSRSNN